MRAVFKADRAETRGGDSISDWWLEPRTKGPNVNAHDEDHVFYVIAGTVSLQVDGEQLDLPQGGYALVPGGAPHTLENRGTVRAGFISFNSPGGCEEKMPDIAAALSAEDLRL